jgi:hypothetical protein
MTSKGVRLSELYEKALSCAVAEGLLSAQDQERLKKSLSAVFAVLRQYRSQQQQVAKLGTGLPVQKPTLFYGLTPGEASGNRMAAKEPSALQQSVPEAESALPSKKPAKPPAPQQSGPGQQSAPPGKKPARLPAPRQSPAVQQSAPPAAGEPAKPMAAKVLPFGAMPATGLQALDSWRQHTQAR